MRHFMNEVFFWTVVAPSVAGSLLFALYMLIAILTAVSEAIVGVLRTVWRAL